MNDAAAFSAEDLLVRRISGSFCLSKRYAQSAECYEIVTFGWLRFDSPRG